MPEHPVYKVLLDRADVCQTHIQQNFIDICSNEFYANRTKNVKHTAGISFMP
jgi:hypothetical protein